MTEVEARTRLERAALWRAQVAAVMRYELKRIVSFRGAAWLVLLAAWPWVILLGHAVAQAVMGRECSVSDDARVLGAVVHVYYIRIAVFFGCLGVFTRLFRGEMAQRTLHHFLLAPIRREVLLVGKFLGAAAGTALIFSVGVVGSFAIMFGHLGGPGREFFFHGPGLSQLGAYLLATVLACLGYGAVFLVFGLAFRNPALPALLLFGWETFSSVFPAWLQRLTVTFYLKPLLPASLPSAGIGALFSVIVEPVPAWLAVAGLCAFASLVVFLAALRVRRLEIDYASD